MDRAAVARETLEIIRQGYYFFRKMNVRRVSENGLR